MGVTVGGVTSYQTLDSAAQEMKLTVRARSSYLVIEQHPGHAPGLRGVL